MRDHETDPDRPLWSVVTVTYNSADMLAECWDQPDKPFEWIVVDNRSDDASAAVAEELGARVLRLPENVGFARANNIGVGHATGRYLLFGNPDLVLSADGLDPLRAHLDRYGGIVAPQLMETSGEPQPNARGFPYLTARLGNRHVWPFSRLHRSYRVFAEPGEGVWVPWVTGAALAVRAGDFHAIGGWNERFFVYYEDIEMCLRAWRAGMPVAVLGDVRWVHHWHRANNTFRLSRAHLNEIRAARMFYGMFPEFVFSIPPVHRRHPQAAARLGQRVSRVPGSRPPAARGS